MDFFGKVITLQLMFSTMKCHRASDESETKASQSGDVILGGLFPVHSYCPRGCKDSCGELRSLDVVYFTEAMVYAIDAANNDSNILPGILLGYEILDYCSKDVTALEKASLFLHSCNREKSPPVVVGIVGPYSSSVSLQVSNLLGLFKVPHVSYGATSPLLSDKKRFKYFSRTVPSDRVRAQALVDLLLKNNTKYVSVVYSDDEFGREGSKYFKQEAESRGICIGRFEGISQDDLNSTFGEIVNVFSDRENVNVVILFCSKKDIRDLFNAVKMRRKQGHFHWLVGGDSAEMSVYLNGNEDMAKDMIICSPTSEKDSEFEKWMNKINESRNPWIQEMNLVHNDSRNLHANSVNEDGQPLSPDGSIESVVNAVYTLVNALDTIYEVQCKNATDRKLCVVTETENREAMVQTIRGTTFTNKNGRRIMFDNNGDILPKYDLLRPQRDPLGTWGLKKVGHWDPVAVAPGPSRVKLFEEKGFLPKTFCSLPCRAGEIKIVVKNCCWKCYQCKVNEITEKRQTECTPCEKGFVPDINKTKCLQLPMVNVDSCQGYVIFNVCISGVGILCTLLVLVVFVVLNKHPVIKASSRGLSCVLLIGIVISYSDSFLDLLAPDPRVCSMKGYTSIGHVTCYTVMLSKLLRINRLFNSSLRETLNPTFVSTRSQLGLVGLMLVITVIFATGWGFYSYSNSVLDIYTQDHVIKQCKVTELVVGVINTFYLTLLSLCAVYTFKTRKLPNKFRETRGLVVAIYMAATLHLIVLLTVFTTNDQNLIRSRAVNVSHPLAASAVLFPIFSPKLYSVIFGSDKGNALNTRKNTPLQTHDRDEVSDVSRHGKQSPSEHFRRILNSSTDGRRFTLSSGSQIHADSRLNLYEDCRSRATSTDTLRSSVGVVDQDSRAEDDEDGRFVIQRSENGMSYSTWL